MAISIETAQREGWDIISVEGEVDIRTAPQLREHISRILSEGSLHLLLDLDNVEFVDSTALSVMVGAHKQLARNGGGLVLVCTRESVLRVLAVTGLSRVFTVHDSIESVLESREPTS